MALRLRRVSGAEPQASNIQWPVAESGEQTTGGFKAGFREILGKEGREPVLKNRFRKLIGLLVLALFGVAVAQYFRQMAGNPYVLSALGSGMWMLLLLAAVLAAVWWADRRSRVRGE